MLDGILTRSAPMTAGTLPITVVIPTLNEAPRLAEAIESVQWADEVLVATALACSAEARVNKVRAFRSRSAAAMAATCSGVFPSQ